MSWGNWPVRLLGTEGIYSFGPAEEAKSLSDEALPRSEGMGGCFWELAGSSDFSLVPGVSDIQLPLTRTLLRRCISRMETPWVDACSVFICGSFPKVPLPIVLAEAPPLLLTSLGVEGEGDREEIHGLRAKVAIVLDTERDLEGRSIGKDFSVTL